MTTLYRIEAVYDHGYEFLASCPDLETATALRDYYEVTCLDDPAFVVVRIREVTLTTRPVSE